MPEVVDGALAVTVVTLAVAVAVAITRFAATAVRMAWEERHTRRLARQLAADAAQRCGVAVASVAVADAEWREASQPSRNPRIRHHRAPARWSR